MFKMVIREKECSIPEPRPAYQRRPFCGVRRIDVVVLPEAIEGKGNREDQKDRDDVKLPGQEPAAEGGNRGEKRQLKGDGDEPFGGDPLAKLRGIRGRFLRGGP